MKKMIYIAPATTHTPLTASAMLCTSGSRPANAINFNYEDFPGATWHAD